jgi:hypothetical protein
VTACDVVRRPYRGHEAATDDPMPKGVEGYVVPPWPWYGGRMDQLMVQVDEGGSRPCGVEGESLVEVWRGGKVLVACGARPFGGRARHCCLLDRHGPKPSPGGLVISSFSFMQLRVDEI